MRHALASLLVFFVMSCAAVHADAADDLTPQIYDTIQARLRGLKIAENRGPRNEEFRSTIKAKLHAMDAREVESTGVLKLQQVDLTEDDLKVICQLRSLHAVSFQDCTFTAAGFAHLAENWSGTLIRLRLSYVQVVGGESIVPSMEKLNKLQWLSINKCRGIELDVVQAVAKFPIETLDMNRPSSGIDAVKLLDLLGAEFPSLTRLDLHHWQKFDDERAALAEKRPGIFGNAKNANGFDGVK